MPDYSWPPMEKRRVIGKATKRVDGGMKASGRAKYASDFTQKDLLFGALLTCPHAHARVTSIDTGEAEKVPGVTAVRVIAKGEQVMVGQMPDRIRRSFRAQGEWMLREKRGLELIARH